MDLARTPPRRRVLFTAYYFVEGAPIGFLWWALPSILRAEGAGTERIGALLGWLVLPWALKWVWAPLIDLLQGPRWGLRAWIGAAQLGMASALVPLAVAGDLAHAEWLVPCLLAHAVFAATQDAAIDALMIATTPSGERGRLAGWMQAGMLAGRSLLGGGALLVLDRVGERGVVLVMLAIVVGGLGLLPLYRPPLPATGERAVDARALGRRFRAALSRRTTWLGLAFAATAGAGFEALGAFAGPLLTELTGTTALAGRFFLVHAVVGMVAGGLAGGWLTDRVGARRGTVLAGLALGVAVLASAFAIERAEVDVLVPFLAASYVTVGWFTAASYALFMEWTDPRLGATQFSAYMGATNLCESWSASVAGRIIPRAGYGPSFAALALIGLVALLLTTRRVLAGSTAAQHR